MSADDSHDGPGSVQGIVSATGHIEGGVGFSITKTGIGRYNIGFLEHYADVPVVVITPTAPGHVAGVSPSVVGADVTLTDLGGTPDDAGFGFFVTPPRAAE